MDLPSPSTRRFAVSFPGGGGLYHQVSCYIFVYVFISLEAGWRALAGASEISLFISLCFSVESWDMMEGEMEVRDWPELLSEAPVMGGAGCGPGLPRLKRAQGSRHLGVDLAFNADSEHAGERRNKHFTSSGRRSDGAPPVSTLELLSCAGGQSDASASDEDLIKRILTDGHRFFPQNDASEMADL